MTHEFLNAAQCYYDRRWTGADGIIAAAMNIFGMGPMELLLIVVLALIVFGPARLPEIMSQVGKAIDDFRRATSELSDEFNKTIQAELQETQGGGRRDQVGVCEVRSTVAEAHSSVNSAVTGHARTDTHRGAHGPGRAASAERDKPRRSHRNGDQRDVDRDRRRRWPTPPSGAGRHLLQHRPRMSPAAPTSPRLSRRPPPPKDKSEAVEPASPTPPTPPAVQGARRSRRAHPTVLRALSREHNRAASFQAARAHRIQ